MAKTLLIIGGRVGTRVAKLAHAFDMRVVATKRDASRGVEGVDSVYRYERLPELLPSADIVTITCPLTPDTQSLLDAKALVTMKPSAHLINVARGRIVDEDALIHALREKRIGAAGLDVTREEPLPAVIDLDPVKAHPEWEEIMPFIRITILGPRLTAENIQRIQRGTTDLMVSVMRKPIEGIAALVEQISDGAWSIAGRPMGVAAHVEATVAQGTNTPDEKARFIAEMWPLLRSELGPELREETYIVVHEIDTRAYGRGGLTRAERDRRQQGGG